MGTSSPLLSPTNPQGNNCSARMHLGQRLSREIASLAPTPSRVLITGETGTGKTAIARLIHRLSDRARHPFVHIDCASIPNPPAEAEFFGDERRDFTGALGPGTGRLELASLGTVFLDEIGAMNDAIQRRLLHVLERKEFASSPGHQASPRHARVLAATTHNVERMLEEGQLRPDLYYRLHVARLQIPPLRQRMEDFSELTLLGLKRATEQISREPVTASGSFLDRIKEHSWPGNVRELFNFLEAVVVKLPKDRSFLTVEDADEALLRAPQENRGQTCEHCCSRAHREAENATSDSGSVLEATLRATGGNVSRAARRLGVPRSTLRYRIERAGLRHLVPTD